MRLTVYTRCGDAVFALPCAAAAVAALIGVVVTERRKRRRRGCG
jgi:hypothetical protein